MLASIQIQNFRCFRQLEVAPLKRVNLILGQNNAGKTALLEALAIMLAQPNPSACGDLPHQFRPGVRNGDLHESFWNWLFYGKDTHTAIELRWTTVRGGKHGWLLTREPPEKYGLQQGKAVAAGSLGDIPAYALEQDGDGLTMVHRSTTPRGPNQEALDFNRVVVKRRKSDLVELLRPLEPRLETLEALQVDPAGTRPLIYADLGLQEMIPVIHLGEGFCRLLGIFSEILASGAQVLLVDEIENGIHHSVMGTVWHGLFNASRNAGLQIFATTHSQECIWAASAAAQESGSSSELGLVRLDRVGGEIKATVMDEKTLAEAKKLGWELR